MRTIGLTAEDEEAVAPAGAVAPRFGATRQSRYIDRKYADAVRAAHRFLSESIGSVVCVRLVNVG